MKLVNITRIENYVNKTYHTLIRWKRDLNFPMYKVGGVWEAESSDIDEWKDCQKSGKEFAIKEKTPTKSRSRSKTGTTVKKS